MCWSHRWVGKVVALVCSWDLFTRIKIWNISSLGFDEQKLKSSRQLIQKHKKKNLVRLCVCVCYLAVQCGLIGSTAVLAWLVPRQQHSPLSHNQHRNNTILWVMDDNEPLHRIKLMSVTFCCGRSPGSWVGHTPLWPVYGTSCAPAVCSWCICSLVFQDPRFGPYRWHNALAGGKSSPQIYTD